MNSHAFVAKLAKVTDVSVGFLPAWNRWTPTWRLHTRLYKLR